jgi:hypothetical protein
LGTSGKTPPLSSLSLTLNCYWRIMASLSLPSFTCHASVSDKWDLLAILMTRISEKLPSFTDPQVQGRAQKDGGCPNIDK